MCTFIRSVCFYRVCTSIHVNNGYIYEQNSRRVRRNQPPLTDFKTDASLMQINENEYGRCWQFRKKIIGIFIFYEFAQTCVV